MAKSGTLRKVTINAISYGVVNDNDPTFNTSKYENEALATGGGDNVNKQTIRVPLVDGVQLRITDAATINRLKEAADNGTEIPVSVTTNSDIVYRSPCYIVGDNNWTPQDAVYTLSFAPVDDWVTV